MIATLLSALVIWFGVHWAYVAVMSAIHQNRVAALSLYWRVHIYPLVLIGLALDVAYNAVFGTIMFIELPREWLFTTRCQRHYYFGSGWRKKMAAFVAKQLNAFDDGHI